MIASETSALEATETPPFTIPSQRRSINAFPNNAQ